jgi:hypothetical protein
VTPLESICVSTSSLLSFLPLSATCSTGAIDFEDSGELIVSPAAHLPSLQGMGVETKHFLNVGGFTEGQRRFLEIPSKRGADEGGAIAVS